MEEVVVNFGNQTVRVGKFPTRRGLRVLTRLLRMVGPAVMGAVGEGEEAKVDVATFVDKVLDHVKADDIDWFVDECITITEMKLVEGTDSDRAWVQLKPGRFDETFGGDYKGVLLWLRACIQENFVNFLAQVGAASTPEEAPAP